MITASLHPRHLETRTWQQELAEAITRPEELAAALGLSPEAFPGAQEAGRRFRLRVPRSFVARMRPGDVNDPLLRQVLPVGAELADEIGIHPSLYLGILHRLCEFYELDMPRRKSAAHRARIAESQRAARQAARVRAQEGREEAAA